jgi:hypothetical protein
MSRRSLLRQGVPGLVIAGALIFAYTEQRPQSGVVVRTVAGTEPTAGYVRITKPQLRSTLAGGRIAAGQAVRYRLQPGAYVIRPGFRKGLRAAPIRIQVREDRFQPVTVRYRPAELRPGRRRSPLDR